MIRCSNRKMLGVAMAWRQGQSYSEDLRGPRKLTPAQEVALAAHIAAHPEITLGALQTWLAGEHAVRLSNGAMWSAVARLGLSFKKRRSAPPSRTVRTSRRGAGSGARRSPSSMQSLSIATSDDAGSPVPFIRRFAGRFTSLGSRYVTGNWPERRAAGFA